MIKEWTLNYISDLTNVLDNFPIEKFEKITNILLNAYKRDSTIFTFGNGGSGSTASHFACDINKGVSLKLNKKFRVICLNDNIPILLAYANDQSYEDVFIEQLKNFLKPNDVIIGISGSGNSKNVLKAIQYGNENSAITIGFTGFEGGKLVKIAKESFVAPVNDMQKVEDIHIIITHIIMQLLANILNKE
ncbi:MAG: SIS domain-containing protein [Candidatus Firestonebacteria bacterium]|nr:SIS domain-containing protein [Candidatus Firestonebacteria bacterium]